MPTISRFFGILIQMYLDAHPPPHFHAIYGEFDAQISIDTLEVLRGHLPRRVQVLVMEWAMAHRPELRENWRRAERHDPLLQIVPLPVGDEGRAEMERVTSVRALPTYRLEIEFSDGVRGVLDYEDRLFGPMMEPLRDSARFARLSDAGIDEWSVICWPNGADLAPDAIYDRLKAGAAGAR